MNSAEDRRQFWRAHLQRCREHGMTLKAYAEQEGLTLSVFYGWSRRLKQSEPKASAFSRVVQSSSSPEYRLCFPNGLVLEWNGEADTAQLTALVRLLG